MSSVCIKYIILLTVLSIAVTISTGYAKYFVGYVTLVHGKADSNCYIIDECDLDN